MPPCELGRSVDQTASLAGKQHLQEPGAFAKYDAAQGAADADESGPEDDAREIFMAQQNQAQPREQR